MYWKTVCAVVVVLGGFWAFGAMGQEWTPWPGPQAIGPARATQAVYDEAVEGEPLPQASPLPGRSFGAEVQILPEPPVVGSVRLNQAEAEEPAANAPGTPIAWAQPPAAPEAPQGVAPPAGKPAAAKPEPKEEFFTLD
ncbi:MAG TPA: hypothetical protein PK777_18365, partial [Thermoguttaceae bacterium]|nr:hypothetical protein [Thermoguttaceae bacterium]